MDGNQRWASKHNLRNEKAYLEGVKKLTEVIEFCIINNIKNLTVFALSAENTKRKSVSIIYNLIKNNYIYFLKKINKDNKVKINFIGEKKGIEKKINLIFNSIEKNTKNNQSLNLNIVFNYSVNHEIINIIEKVISKKSFNEIYQDENLINSYKYLGFVDDPQILIRTGGFKRLSNFIPLNLTYTELFFIDTLWPEFELSCLKGIMQDYKKIKKNYGL